MKKVILKKGREKSLLRRHPWIFSGAVERVEGSPEAGENVMVCSADGRKIGVGAYSPSSQLTVRMWSFDPHVEVNGEYIRSEVRRAASLRKFLKLDDPAGACRLIFSESDGLPGVVADRYGEYAVVQILSAGAEHFRNEIAEAILELDGIRGVYERSDVSVRAYEGLPERVGMLGGDELPEEILIDENAMKIRVNPRLGHKTGYYLDQRDARLGIRDYTEGMTVLNAFAYTGAFAVSALLGGARHVTNVDSSQGALDGAARNLELNHFAPDRFENITGDVFEQLRRFRKEKRTFDMVILDPPKFVESRAALVRACRAYKDIAMLGFSVLNPGGLLVNFSCSGLLEEGLFQKLTADAALDGGVNAQMLRKFRQSADHPVLLSMPENAYLKGMVSKIG